MKVSYIAALTLWGLGMQAMGAVAGEVALKTEAERVSYTIGVDIGENLRAQSIEVLPDQLTRGIKDGLAGGHLLMTREAMQQTLVSLQKKLVEVQRAQLKDLAEKNAKAGAAFLAENKARPGVMILPNGVQYKVIEGGQPGGATPAATDTVSVDYEGRFLNGEVFDSSYQRGAPAAFDLTKVVPGFQAALQKMPVGSTWEIYIPGALGFGEQGAPGTIEPNQLLIFKVHLVGIQPTQVKGTQAGSKAPSKAG